MFYVKYGEIGNVRNTTEHAVRVEVWSYAACRALRHLSFAHVELQTKQVISDFRMYYIKHVRFSDWTTGFNGKWGG